MLALAFVVLASAFVARSSPTCSQQPSPKDASDPGECLLQPNVATNTLQKQGHHDLVITEENAEDEDASGDDEDDEDEFWEAEAGDDHSTADASLQQMNANGSWTMEPGRCFNWFGNNLDWAELKAHGIAEHKSAGVWGTLMNNSWYPNINICNWDTTAGVDVPNKQLSYYCAGLINGKIGSCKSTTILGKNGGGIRVDCVNGLCADKSNIKHDWTKSYKGVTCAGTAAVPKRLAPALYLKSPKGNPQRSKWDPVCKVMCESIPECTGFTVNILKRRAQCRFFGGDSPATKSAEGYEAYKAKCGTARKCCNPGRGCCNHPHYNTYFVTRK